MVGVGSIIAFYNLADAGILNRAGSIPAWGTNIYKHGMPLFTFKRFKGVLRFIKAT